jgi:hypothetical protein
MDDTKRDLALQLILSDGSVYPEKGRMFFADRQVNPTTGTLQIAGLFKLLSTVQLYRALGGGWRE